MPKWIASILAAIGLMSMAVPADTRQWEADCAAAMAYAGCMRAVAPPTPIPIPTPDKKPDGKPATPGKAQPAKPAQKPEAKPATKPANVQCTDGSCRIVPDQATTPPQYYYQPTRRGLFRWR